MSSVKGAILVTGAASGLGLATVTSLSHLGYPVFAGFRDPSGRNAAAVEEIRMLTQESFAPVTFLDLDVTNDASVAHAIDGIASSGQRLETVINNAGIMWIGVTEAYTPNQCLELFDVNVFGSVRVNRAALPLLHKGGRGLLVHVSSLSGGLVFPFFNLYNASKAALEAFAEGYRYELLSMNIDSVVIEPGPFPTKLLNSQRTPDDPERLGRYGTLADKPMQLETQIASMYASSGAQPVEAYTQALAELVATPIGKRPFRTIAGDLDFGLRTLNAQKAKTQSELLEAWGLGYLETPETSRPS